MKKKSFILYYDWYQNIRELSQEQKWNLLDAIFQFHNWGVTVEMWWVENMAFNFIKWSFERDKEKWEEIKRSRSEAWRLWWRPKKNQEEAKKANAFSEKQSKAKKAVNVTVPVNVPVNENIESSTLIISDVNSVFPNLPVPTEFWDPEINAVIKSIKEFCMQHKIIYDSTDDRMYGKHIAKAKEFWTLAETMGKSRNDFWESRLIVDINNDDAHKRYKCSWYLFSMYMSLKFKYVYPQDISQNDREIFLRWSENKTYSEVTSRLLEEIKKLQVA